MPVGLGFPESETVAEGDPLGWLAAVIVLNASWTAGRPVNSWFCRLTVKDPKPVEHAAADAPVVADCGNVVLAISRGTPITDGWLLMSSWKIPNSAVGPVQT